MGSKILFRPVFINIVTGYRRFLQCNYIVYSVTGFVRVLENLESHGISIFQNPGLEILENQF